VQALFEGIAPERHRVTPATGGPGAPAALHPYHGVRNSAHGLARFQTMSSAVQAVLEIAPLSVVGVTRCVVDHGPWENMYSMG